VYDAGANRPILIAALRERDESLGWRCYTDRRDAEEQYAVVVDELERTGRNGHRSGPASTAGGGEEHPAAAPGRFNLTDLGNAERLVYRDGKDLLYVHPWHKWLAWDGKRWKVDDSGEVERMAVETVRSIYAEATKAEDSQERKAIASHAKSSEDR
jgi:putative DNA primase/helicase